MFYPTVPSFPIQLSKDDCFNIPTLDLMLGWLGNAAVAALWL